MRIDAYIVYVCIYATRCVSLKARCNLKENVYATQRSKQYYSSRNLILSVAEFFEDKSMFEGNPRGSSETEFPYSYSGDALPATQFEGVDERCL